MNGKVVAVILISVVVLIGAVVIPFMIWTGNRIESTMMATMDLIPSVEKAMEEALSEGALEEQEDALEDSEASSRIRPSGVSAQESQLDYSDFHSIRISVGQPDVIVQSGDRWNIEYRIPSHEKIERCELKDGTFFLETDFQHFKRPTHDGWYVKITVPKTAQLNSLSLTSVTGEVTVNSLTAQSIEAESVSDEITLSNIKAKDGKFKSVADDIALSGVEFSSLEAFSTSGDISIDGTADRVSLKTVSGDCSLSGAFHTSCDMVSVSGDISAIVSHRIDVDGRSHGGISYNKDSYRENFRLRQKGAPELVAESTSGEILIEAKES